MDNPQQIDELLKKIDQLTQRQEELQNDLKQLKLSAFLLKSEKEKPVEIKPVPDQVSKPPVVEIKKEEIKPNVVPTPSAPQQVQQPSTVRKEKTPIEEFIGTNLLNKIGIAILVLGISYGVKYSIDHNLINPITRVILGYAAGIAMVLVALKLKVNYKTFSAVILSGGMASMYFITYAAYDFYSLMPQAIAFAMMVLFTVFTAYASLQYDQKVIAIVGLVGAYAVPFLLSDGSGRVVILFSYITIVNAGILALAFKKAWKQLYYIAFAFTWVIFAAWYFDQFNVEYHLWASLIFSTIFFITFYVVFLAYKLIGSEPFKITDIGLIIFNSFVYFGFGYAAINHHSDGNLFLGLFTLFIAVLHFIASIIIFNRREATRETFYLVAGMVLVFLTLAVPVQLDGYWVTVIWAAESALLFWIGRTKSFPVFERFSYVMIFITFISLFDDWKNYDRYTVDRPEYFVKMFLNVQFLSSLLVLVSFGWILKLNFNKQFKAPSEKEFPIISWGLGSVFLLILYLTFYKEIFTFWQQRYVDSEVMIYSGHGYGDYPMWDENLYDFRKIFLLMYSAVFGIVLTIANRQFIKNDKLAMFCAGFNAFVLFLFVTDGLLSLASLRGNYLTQTDARFYFRDFRHIAIRYLSYAAIIPLLVINRKHFKTELFNEKIRQTEHVLFHTFILAVLSSELVNLLELARVHESFKLGLSILWGAYALMLIVFGLKRQSKPLRVMAIVLFSVTILKLFLYDMSEMSTIAKTIVMIILGILMLVASFLYNKVKKQTQ